MKYTMNDIIDVLSESTQDSIEDSNPEIFTEGVVGTTVAIIVALGVINSIYDRISQHNTVVLSGDNLNKYKKLIEIYALENKLPNPKDFKYKHIYDTSFSKFKNFKNIKDIIDDTFNAFCVSENERKTIEDPAKLVYDTFVHGPSSFDMLIYKNEIIATGDSSDFDMWSDVIDKKYAKLLFSYYEPEITHARKNELKTLISYFKDKYPNEMKEAEKLIINNKKKK
jgi:hypothetical protein